MTQGWPALRALTAARIGLQRSGASLATAPLLDFRLAHARARDAVHASLDEAALIDALRQPVLVVASQAPDRRRYLLRPDLGRSLDPDAVSRLAPHAGSYDVAIVLGDGLSARAVQRHAPPLIALLLPPLTAAGLRLAPLVVVRGARVKVGDSVAQTLGANAVLMLIGERPGLSAPDSLGAYLTWSPGAATTDADRNCVSNIRPEGLPYQDAGFRINFLLGQMRSRQLSGVALKDQSGRSPDLLASH
jgi:ethanolamine ammonia-lyase small subunit